MDHFCYGPVNIHWHSGLNYATIVRSWAVVSTFQLPRIFDIWDKETRHLATHDRRYVIIGNGIAGTTAADTLRKNDPNCSIHLITNEPYPLYNRVSLPRFLQGVIVEQKVMIRDFAWHEQRNIQLLTETMATEINTDERVVVTDKGQHLPYDALLVATGGWANPLSVPGAVDCKHIYNFVTLDDTKTIINRMLESRTAVAYGGSFIFLRNSATVFAMRKLNTTWIMRGPLLAA